MKISRASFEQEDFSRKVTNLTIFLPACTPENVTRYIEITRKDEKLLILSIFFLLLTSVLPVIEQTNLELHNRITLQDPVAFQLVSEKS